jgi:hypothetical protein
MCRSLCKTAPMHRAISAYKGAMFHVLLTLVLEGSDSSASRSSSLTPETYPQVPLVRVAELHDCYTIVQELLPFREQSVRHKANINSFYWETQAPYPNNKM